MITFLAAAIYFLTLFTVIEVLSRKASLSIEVSRKMAHILAGVSAASLPFIMSFTHIVALSLLFLIVMLLSRKKRVFRSIHDVKRQSYGELFFPLTIAITAQFFPNIHAYIFGILVMALGDGLAGLLGSRFGKTKYRSWTTNKSYLGSTVFFITTVLVGCVFTHNYMIIAVAFILTCVEAMSVRGLDNLLLSPIGALLLSSIL
jgi:phytol kinase